jgi:DNA-binding CsgD family transcriptional regulator
MHVAAVSAVAGRAARRRAARRGGRRRAAPREPYLAFSLTSIGLAAVVARPRTVWLTVLVLEVTYALAILAERSPAELVASDRSAVLGQMLGYLFVALVALGVTRLFARFLARVQPLLDDIRDGTPALTPALTLAIARGPLPIPQLPAPSPGAQLTPAERRIVQGLACGRTPKQLARELGVSPATVRTHIKHAKRKTGARTLPQLSGMAARRDWPGSRDRGR